MKFPAVVSSEVAANQVVTFEHIVPISLPAIFTGYGPLPAVIGTKNQTGAWDAVGQTRTVLLSDGSSAQELLTRYEYPRYFSYTVSGFTGTLRFLTSSADGEWWFTPNTLGKTSIKWRYVFDARSVFAAPILWFVSKVLWRSYMNKALSLSVRQIQGSAALNS